MTKTNKKSIIAIAFSFCLMISAVFLLAACGHSHEYSETWSVDETSHWHVCTGKDCDEVKDKAAHTFVADGENQKCSVCNRVKSTLTIEPEDFTYGDTSIETFQMTWITGYSGGCDNDPATYSYEYFTVGENNSLTSIGSTFPTNAGTYQVKVSYVDEYAEDEVDYLPTSATGTFTIEKRQLATFEVYADLEDIVGDTNPTLNVQLNKHNVTYQGTLANNAINKIANGDNVNAKVTFKGKEKSSLINAYYGFTTAAAAASQTEAVVIELLDPNYSFTTLAGINLAKKLTNGTAEAVVSPSGSGKYYSFTYELDAGKKATFTLSRTADNDDSKYATIDILGGSVNINLLATENTKTFTLDNSKGTKKITETIFIKAVPSVANGAIDNTIKLDFTVLEA